LLNFLSMNDSVLNDAIRGIFAMFDRFIYMIISLVYEIIIEISNIQIFSDNTIEEFAGRIYTLIGIFMLFKLSFSVISYIINPDTVFDKEKGGSKLLVNIVITFVLIIIMPTVFDYMGRAQTAILKGNIIENFILGTDGETGSTKFKMSEDCPNERNIDEEGDYIALMVFRPFYQIDPNGKDPAGLISDGTYCNAESVSELLVAKVYNSPSMSGDGVGTNGNYNIDYGFLISTLVGGVVALVLVGFAMDVAVRAIKLSFLQLIAPIPIMSYIDPSQSKNGMFKKWLTELGKTWGDLFIKLAALYFVIKIITMIDSIEVITESVEHKFWIPILIIIGGLIFAKQLPTLIGNMLGIKLDGGFSINPMKKIRDQAMFGNLAAGAVTGGVAAGGALMAGGIANAYAARKNLGKKWAEMDNKDRFFGVLGAAGSTIGGAGSSMLRTIANGKDGKFTPIKNIEKGVTASSKARESRADGWGVISNARDRVAAMGQVKFSTGHSFERDNEIKELQMHLENYKRDENTAAIGMSNILSSNGGAKASLYQEAFRNEVVQEDGMFKYKRATPNNYFDWASSKGFDAQAKWNEIESDFRRMGASAEELERLTRDSFDHYVESTFGNSMLTRNEYENYGTLFDARNEADFQGRKTEKDIKKKQENKPNKDK